MAAASQGRQTQFVLNDEPTFASDMRLESTLRVSNYFLFRSLSAGRDEDEVDAEGHLRLIDRPVLAHVEAINVAA